MKRLFKINKDRKRGIHRNNRDAQLKIAEWIYPSIGVKAWVKYTLLSLKRKDLSSHKIALGFAIGAFVSFTPFLGLHGLIAIAIAYFLGASIVTSLIGTLVGNPWTFPLIWAWCLSLGNFFLHRSTDHYTETVMKFNLHSFLENTAMYWDKYILPMCTGGIPTGILVGLFFYFFLKYQIDKFRSIRKAMLHKRSIERRTLKIKSLRDGLAALKNRGKGK